MPIPESTLSKWSHNQAKATVSKQAHVPIREAPDTCAWPSDVKYKFSFSGNEFTRKCAKLSIR